MVVKEDGTKWACQSCLKGHRVSGCTHTDRPLVFVPKKGRPVTQCGHCRVERKKRSAHVKCDCGEKPHSKDKCIHLRDTDGHHVDGVSSDLEPLPEDHEVDDMGCCCHHGGKCTCATLKKEPGEDSGDSSPSLSASHPRSKPRLTSTQSDGHITVFANGHHKPVHRHNNAAHESGLPYRMPRAHTDQAASKARRSVDSLHAMDTNIPAPWQQTFPIPAASASQQFASHEGGTTGLPAPGLYNLPASQQASTTSMTSVPTFGISQSPDSVMPASGFKEFRPSNYEDFSNSNDSVNTFATSWPTQTPDLDMAQTNDDMWNNFDWTNLNGMTANQPALTNASSGTISEIDDLPAPDDFSTVERQALMTTQDSSTAGKQQDGGNSAIGQVLQEYRSDLDQMGRWSLPTYFNGMANLAQFIPTSDTSNEANAASSPMHWLGEDCPPMEMGDMYSGQAVPATSNTSSKPLCPSNPPNRSRPQAIYQKSIDTSNDLGWEAAFDQFNGSGIPASLPSQLGNGFPPSMTGLSGTNGLNQDTNRAISNPDVMGNSYQFDASLSTFQSTDDDENPMSQEYLNNFGLEDDFSDPNVRVNWAS